MHFIQLDLLRLFTFYFLTLHLLQSNVIFFFFILLYLSGKRYYFYFFFYLTLLLLFSIYNKIRLHEHFWSEITRKSKKKKISQIRGKSNKVNNIILSYLHKCDKKNRCIFISFDTNNEERTYISDVFIITITTDYFLFEFIFFRCALISFKFFFSVQKCIDIIHFYLVASQHQLGRELNCILIYYIYDVPTKYSVYEEEQKRWDGETKK